MNFWSKRLILFQSTCQIFITQQKQQNFKILKQFMSEHQTHLQDKFISHEKTHLFETSSDTVHRHKKWVSINLKLFLKQISDSSEIDSQLHDNEELSEESISTSLRSESSIMTFQDSVDQNTSNDQDNDNQQSSSQNTILAEHNAVIHQ